ncbi:hypothetical protein [Halalkalibacterium ligniniphilum]|uniref:hypothetical protein n=1 Tax=Halalkalibacterium ligniniphilum TaxID=1134413 RepID=UPI00035D0FAA|nr:hypothetical protein [Halalkalibacterium ligniniphilum]
MLEADRLMIKQAMHIPSIKRRIEKGDSQYKKTEILHSVKRIYKKLRLYRMVHQGLVTRYIRNQDKEITEGTVGFPFDEFLQRRIDNVEKSESEMKTIIEKEQGESS